MSVQKLSIRERIAQVLNVIDQAEIEEVAQIRAENRVWLETRKAQQAAFYDGKSLAEAEIDAAISAATFDQFVEEELEIAFDGWGC